mmetsp:Transcript_13585/g.20569  ORF Transcript_13585/g.20569 Transcript_13585/m.20569 type:complete len:980 (+) Transcript_13585:35-2974(+)
MSNIITAKKKLFKNNPNNKHWKSNKKGYGYKTLCKLGWEEGQGLGVRASGETNNIEIELREEGAGIGMRNKAKENGERVTSQRMIAFQDVLAKFQPITLPTSSTTSLSAEEQAIFHFPTTKKKKKKKKRGKTPMGNVTKNFKKLITEPRSQTPTLKEKKKTKKTRKKKRRALSRQSSLKSIDFISSPLLSRQSSIKSIDVSEIKKKKKKMMMGPLSRQSSTQSLKKKSPGKKRRTPHKKRDEAAEQLAAKRENERKYNIQEIFARKEPHTPQGSNMEITHMESPVTPYNRDNQEHMKASISFMDTTLFDDSNEDESTDEEDDEELQQSHLHKRMFTILSTTINRSKTPTKNIVIDQRPASPYRILSQSPSSSSLKKKQPIKKTLHKITQNALENHLVESRRAQLLSMTHDTAIDHFFKRTHQVRLSPQQIHYVLEYRKEQQQLHTSEAKARAVQLNQYRAKFKNRMHSSLTSTSPMNTQASMRKTLQNEVILRSNEVLESFFKSWIVRYRIRKQAWACIKIQRWYRVYHQYGHFMRAMDLIQRVHIHERQQIMKVQKVLLSATAQRDMQHQLQIIRCTQHHLRCMLDVMNRKKEAQEASIIRIQSGIRSMIAQPGTAEAIQENAKLHYAQILQNQIRMVLVQESIKEQLKAYRQLQREAKLGESFNLKELRSNVMNIYDTLNVPYSRRALFVYHCNNALTSKHIRQYCCSEIEAFRRASDYLMEDDLFDRHLQFVFDHLIELEEHQELTQLIIESYQPCIREEFEDRKRYQRSQSEKKKQMFAQYVKRKSPLTETPKTPKRSFSSMFGKFLKRRPSKQDLTEEDDDDDMNMSNSTTYLAPSTPDRMVTSPSFAKPTFENEIAIDIVESTNKESNCLIFEREGFVQANWIKRIHHLPYEQLIRGLIPQMFAPHRSEEWHGNSSYIILKFVLKPKRDVKRIPIHTAIPISKICSETTLRGIVDNRLFDQHAYRELMASFII